MTKLRSAGCVFAEDEARMLMESADDPADLALMVERRAGGLPLEHVVGWAEFRGLRVALDPGVFVPRRRSELLAGEAIARTRPGALVVDLCCGSGALGAAVASAVSGVELYAADIDPAAVACARRNLLAAAGQSGQVDEGDLFAPLPGRLRGRVEVLVANVPYVPTRELRLLPGEAREHEARVALDGGMDGLAVLRRVAAQAPEWLAPGGHLLVETSDRQAAQAAETFARVGLIPRTVTSEPLDATVVIGTRVGTRSRSWIV